MLLVNMWLLSDAADIYIIYSSCSKFFRSIIDIMNYEVSKKKKLKNISEKETILSICK